MRIGMIGLGRMGAHMAQRLMRGGHQLAGFDPKPQARKDLEGGGIYLNNVREANPQRTVLSKDLLFGKHLLLRKGKRNYVAMTAS